jgi:hypothetical protein
MSNSIKVYLRNFIGRVRKDRRDFTIQKLLNASELIVKNESLLAVKLREKDLSN